MVVLSSGEEIDAGEVGVGSPARFVAETVEGTDYTRLIVRLSVKERVRMAVICRLIESGESPAQKVYDIVSMSKWGEIDG